MKYGSLLGCRRSGDWISGSAPGSGIHVGAGEGFPRGREQTVYGLQVARLERLGEPGLGARRGGERAGERLAIRHEDVGPELRVAAGDAGEVAEAAGGERERGGGRRG